MDEINIQHIAFNNLIVEIFLESRNISRLSNKSFLEHKIAISYPDSLFNRNISRLFRDTFLESRNIYCPDGLFNRNISRLSKKIFLETKNISCSSLFNKKHFLLDSIQQEHFLHATKVSWKRDEHFRVPPLLLRILGMFSKVLSLQKEKTSNMMATSQSCV